ncbi:MAG TPA: VCBS repeat-containing protein [Candidatus Saccharibacteria bacterium]|nr:VCBS repeat-containing protein [Candidatus Saccharibacteria bacterium]HRK94427.1 VCBS repeat-containing protein [Candidatus Saccharibacteria bacterium]
MRGTLVRIPRKLKIAAAIFTCVAVAAPAIAASLQVEDRAVVAGITVGTTDSWDVGTGDVDGDGDVDFHVSLHMKNPGMLYSQNDDGTFTRTAFQVVSPRPTPGYTSKSYVDRHASVIADFDGNDLGDIYNSAGRYASNRVKGEDINNELFLQTAPGVFQDFATQYGVGEPCQRGRHVLATDWNSDGWPDLFIGAQVERAVTDACDGYADHPYNEQPHVYINLGDPEQDGTWNGFRTAPEFNVSAKNTGVRMALEWDYNHDGRPDLLSLTFPNKKPTLLRNTGSGFVNVTSLSLPYMNGAKVGDVTGDGIDDLVYGDNAGFKYREGTATGLSTTVRPLGTVGSNADGWTVALGDANGDGKLDVYGQVSGATATAGNPDDILFMANASGGYQQHVVPSAGGDANDVEAIDVNGRAQFVVLNGGNDEATVPGPIQLIAFLN